MENWTQQDFFVELEERAAIVEYDAGLPRNQAETLSIYCLRRRMANYAIQGKSLGKAIRMQQRSVKNA